MSECLDLRLYNKIGLRTEHTIGVDVSTFPSGSLNGYYIYWSCRRTLTSPSASIALNSVDNPSQVAITDVSGSVKLVLEPANTLGLYPGAYYWQIDAIPIAGVNTLAYPAISYGDIVFQRSIFGVSGVSTPPSTLDQFILADTTSGNFEYTLPAAVSWTGRRITVKADDLSAGVVMIYPYAGETIDGESSFTINSPNGSATFFSDGTNIYLISFI